MTLPRMGEKSADNLLKNIEKSKQRPLARIINSLGIFHVGGETAELLARHFDSMDQLAAASIEDLMAIPSIGPKVAESIFRFFQQEENRSVLEKLKKTGVRLEKEAGKEEVPMPLKGQEFVLTGRLEVFTRPQAEGRIKALGGEAGDNVTRRTAYVIVGSEPGSKLDRARTLGTKLLNEEEFVKLLEEAEARSEK